MVLNGQQIANLATEIEANSNIPRLQMQASQVGEDLANLAPGAGLYESASKLLTRLNSVVPPRIDQFLELLSKGNNARLKAVADELLTPDYYPPTKEPRDAILLGRTAFVARHDLRKSLREFTKPNNNSTRVLIVRGDAPGGKSYTWQFLRHLAVYTGAYPVPLRLKGTSYTPREFFEQVYLLLGLDVKTLPELKDDPQLARIDPLLNAFKGRLHEITKLYWLVIDDLNDPAVTKPVREAAYALASAVEDVRPRHLWVALLGYNDPYDETELATVARDDAEFPTPALVAEHLDLISEGSHSPLPEGRADEIATVLFSKYPPHLDKVAMMSIKREVEKLGEKLKRGEHPS